jgi:hypothetical protein
VLQQEGNLKKWTGDEGTGECKSHHDERPVHVETKGNNWIQVITGHHKRPRKTKKLKLAQLIQIGVNHCELLNELKEQMGVAQSHAIRIKVG